MITLEIDDKKIEDFYYSECDGDTQKFISRISEVMVANNVEEDLSCYQDEIDEGFASGDCGQTIEEVFDELLKLHV